MLSLLCGRDNMCQMVGRVSVFGWAGHSSTTAVVFQWFTMYTTTRSPSSIVLFALYVAKLCFSTLMLLMMTDRCRWRGRVADRKGEGVEGCE